ncbi:MAG TPA: hypothetical protein VF534_01275 [Paraburkholderia sp.]
MSDFTRYEYFGEVSAVKIAALRERDDGTYLVIPEGDEYEPIEVSDSFMSSNNPQVGGYYVVWTKDCAGYMAPDAFANCYRPITPAKAKARGTSRAARELALEHLAAESRHIDAYLREVDMLARYIETGDVTPENDAEDRVAEERPARRPNPADGAPRSLGHNPVG